MSSMLMKYQNARQIKRAEKSYLQVLIKQFSSSESYLYSNLEQDSYCFVPVCHDIPQDSVP